MMSREERLRYHNVQQNRVPLARRKRRAPGTAGGAAGLRYLFVGGKEVVREGRVPSRDVIARGREGRKAGKALLARL